MLLIVYFTVYFLDLIENKTDERGLMKEGLSSRKEILDQYQIICVRIIFIT